MKKAVKKTKKRIVKKSALSLRDKGVSKVVIIAVVAVILLGAGGYFVLGQQKGGSSALPFVKAPLNPNCHVKDPDLCKFLNNANSMKDFTMTNISDIEGQKNEYTYQMLGTDKTHMVSKENGKETMNVISIGDTTYTLDYTDNKWWKQTFKKDVSKPNTEEVMPKETDRFKNIKEEELKDTSSYKKIGKEPCGSLTCFKYQTVDSANSVAAKEYLYFDDKEYLLRRIQTLGDDSIKGDVYFSYESFAISEPSPVKEGNPYGADAMPGYNDEETKKMMEQYQQQNVSGGESENNVIPETQDENTPSEY